MTYTDVVKKLIGEITPVGDTEIDSERLKNLKAMCNLTHDLIDEILGFIETHKSDKRASVKEAVDAASSFANFFDL